MRKINQKKPLARFIAASLAVGAMTGFGAQAYAATSAGTLIKNLATVTYEDASGNTYSAQSNEAVVTVAAVYSGTLENDNVLTAAPGQTVYFPHTLSNTGNIQDTYTVSTGIAPTGSTVKVYNDLNNNGQPDNGEPELSSVTIPAGGQTNIVVAMQVPTTAASGTDLDVKLTVASNSTDATVKDVGGNGDSDIDDASATNDDKATVSTGPVLVLTKASVRNVSDKSVTYTLTVKNTGNSAATNVKISDLLPIVDTNGSTANVQDTLKQVTLSGIITSNGLLNISDGDVAGAQEAIADTTNADANASTTELNAITATDKTLPPNTTISVTYTVNYVEGWAANAKINNTFTATSTLITTPVSSNTTVNVVPQTYAVIAEDNLLGDDDAGNNNGGDDDSTGNNDLQVVDVAATGEEVKFTHTIANNGNGDDIFNLVVKNTDFPSGTTFTLWDATGAVQLGYGDADGIRDTGTLGAGVTRTIMIKAKLPAGISGAGTYNAVLTATSSKDPSVSDTTGLQLETITAPAIDLASGLATSQAQITGTTNTIGFNDDGTDNAHENGPVQLIDAVVGETIIFPLHLANESGSPDSYIPSAANIPTGWDVVFKDEGGNVITQINLLPGGGVFKYNAHVTVSSDPSLAKSDSDQTDAENGSSNGTAVIANGDTDNDYFIDFIATSTSTSGLSDTVRNAIDVAPDREVIITPNGQKQIQPGGTVDYSHKLENNGNQEETVVLGIVDSKANDGWTTLIRIDTNGDGIPDSLLTPATTSVSGSKIDVNGNVTPVTVSVSVDANGVPTFILPAGVDVPLETVVSAPSNAPLGAVNVSTLTADNGDTEVTAQDQTTVIFGQVRLDKKAAIDKDCDGTLTSFSANQATQVAPGGCVVWELSATNEGNATALNVTLSDAAPEYTTLVENALLYCKGNGCSVATVTDAVDTDGASINTSTGLVEFKVGDLTPSQTATAQFTVKVQ